MKKLAALVCASFIAGCAGEVGPEGPQGSQGPAGPGAEEVLAASRTLTQGAGPHRFDTDLRVGAGVTLAVEAGAVVRFAQGRTLHVQGTLKAQGADGNPVVFEGLDGARWGGIVLAAGSTENRLERVTVRRGALVVDGGLDAVVSSAFEDAPVAVTGVPTFLVTNSTFSGSTGTSGAVGLQTTDVPLVNLAGNTFRDLMNTAVVFQLLDLPAVGGAADATLALSNSSFLNVGGDAVYVEANGSMDLGANADVKVTLNNITARGLVGSGLNLVSTRKVAVTVTGSDVADATGSGFRVLSEAGGAATFTGNDVQRTDSVGLNVQAQGGFALTVQDNVVARARTTALNVNIAGPATVTASDNTIEDAWGAAIALAFVDDATVVASNNELRDNQGSGIAVTGHGAVTMDADGNELSGNTAGISLGAFGDSSFRARDNTVGPNQGSALAATAQGNLTVEVTGNQIDGITGTGVVARSFAVLAGKVNGNTIENALGEGINVRGDLGFAAAGLQVNGNTLDALGSNGVNAFTFGAGLFTAASNTVSRCNGSGLSVQLTDATVASNSTALFDGNQVSFCTASGIFVRAYRAEVTSAARATRLEDNLGNGLSTSSFGSESLLTVKGGVFRRNFSHGISIDALTEFDIRGVTAEANANRGIQAASRSAGRIVASVIKDNLVHGVNLAGFQELQAVADIRHNVITGNLQNGVLVDSSRPGTARSTVAFNEISGNLSEGVVGSPSTDITGNNVTLNGVANDLYGINRVGAVKDNYVAGNRRAAPADVDTTTGGSAGGACTNVWPTVLATSTQITAAVCIIAAGTAAVTNVGPSSCTEDCN
jgi:hypothetical protein